MNEWLNIMELAERTKIPDTTVRRYITKFNVFFFHVGGTRSRRYKSSGVEVLLRIKALYDGGYESEEVARQLEQDFPMVLDGDRVEGNLEKADTPALFTAEDIWEIKQELKDLQDIKKELKATQEELKAVKEVLEKLPQSFSNWENSIKETIENRDQLLLEKFTEQEEKKVVAPAPETAKEKKPGLFTRFFKK